MINIRSIHGIFSMYAKIASWRLTSGPSIFFGSSIVFTIRATVSTATSLSSNSRRRFGSGSHDSAVLSARFRSEHKQNNNYCCFRKVIIIYFNPIKTEKDWGKPGFLSGSSELIDDDDADVAAS